MSSDACLNLSRSLSRPHRRGSTSADGEPGIGAASEPGISVASRFSYFRLPADPVLRLSVHKLDGSSFDVRVARKASVRELKKAIEDLFIQPSNDDTSAVSWSHVWGHFCLCHGEGKLTDDKASLRALGIKDGDQLHFIRHLSLSRGSSKRKSSSHKTALEPYRKSSKGSKVHDDTEEKYKDNRDCDGIGSSHVVNKRNHDVDDDYIKIEPTELSLRRRLFRGWFSYSKLEKFHRTKSKKKACSKHRRNHLGLD